MLFKTFSILFVAGMFSAIASAQDADEVTQLRELAALQQARIEALQIKLAKLVGPNGEILANGRMVVNADGKWLGTLTGLQGPTGDRGANGSAGKNGEPGADGKAGKNGRKGADGDPGPKGSAGAKGPPGGKGPIGELGHLGVCGHK